MLKLSIIREGPNNGFGVFGRGRGHVVPLRPACLLDPQTDILSTSTGNQLDIFPTRVDILTTFHIRPSADDCSECLTVHTRTTYTRPSHKLPPTEARTPAHAHQPSRGPLTPFDTPVHCLTRSARGQTARPTDQLLMPAKTARIPPLQTARPCGWPAVCIY